jgi:hypothetical protein
MNAPKSAVSGARRFENDGYGRTTARAAGNMRSLLEAWFFTAELG